MKAGTALLLMKWTENRLGALFLIHRGMQITRQRVQYTRAESCTSHGAGDRSSDASPKVFIDT
jgi:hypothetical protein